MQTSHSPLSIAALLNPVPIVAGAGRMVRLLDRDPTAAPVAKNAAVENPVVLANPITPKAAKKPQKKKPKKRTPETMTYAQAQVLAKRWMHHLCRPELEPIRQVLRALTGRIQEFEGEQCN